MNKVTFTLVRLKAMARPAVYLEELTGCAIARTADALTFDQESPCYQALKAKYADYKPTPEERAHAQKYEAQFAVERQAMVQQNQAANGPAQTTRVAKTGCGGCQGRKIKS